MNLTYFIIYEDEQASRTLYQELILKLVGKNDEQYRIIEIEKYDRKRIKEIMDLEGRKVFILDIEVPGKSGLDLAREIRKVYDDWDSQMIIVTNHHQFESNRFMGRLLMLDFVSKYYNCEEHLREALQDAIHILDKGKFFSFTVDGELYKVPYRSILYIEKDKDEEKVLLVTKTRRKLIKMPINKIWKELESDSRFFKSSRSCIINIHNITKVDLNKRIIKFGKVEISSLARDRKKELKERIKNK